MNCAVTVEIGAYLLGALSPADRTRIQAHLHDCPICQRDVIDLSSLPGLLWRVTPSDIPDPAADDVSAAAPAKRPFWRSNRRWLLAAASALVIAGGTVGGVLATGNSSESRPAATVISGTDPATGLQATARMHSETWGTEVDLQLGDLPRNAWCELVVHTRDGKQEVAGSWSAPAVSGTAQLPTATSFKLADIASMAVLTNGGKQLINLTKSS